MHLNITNIALGTQYADKMEMLQELASTRFPGVGKARVPAYLFDGIDKLNLGVLDAKVKNQENLSLVEAFQGMLLVIAATNNRLREQLFLDLSYESAIAKGSYFLTLMGAKESNYGLTAEEIAGIVAAGYVDVVYVPQLTYVFETCGMGADRGRGTKTVKTINVSTLTALVLSSMGYTSMKHGSYGNTTAVGSTDVMEQFGAEIKLTPEAIAKILKATNFWYNDAHAVKTLHYLSHLLRVETINHIVGPMTPPVAKNTTLYKMLGVNHYVHPAAIAEAYTILHKLGIITLGGLAVVGGVDVLPTRDESRDHNWFRQHGQLDELGFDASIVSFAKGPLVLGTRVLQMSTDFGIQANASSLWINNAISSLMHANEQALHEGPLAEYLASNVALALFTSKLQPNLDTSILKGLTSLVVGHLKSGKAVQQVTDYVKHTGGIRKYW